MTNIRKETASEDSQIGREEDQSGQRKRERTTTFLKFITATLLNLNSLVQRQTTLMFRYNGFAVFGVHAFQIPKQAKCHRNKHHSR